MKIASSRSARKQQDRVTASSGNVFADLKLSHPGERLTKVRLALSINEILKQRRLTQSAAAKLLEVNQPKISALRNLRLEGFSVERLLNFLNALDQDVEIVIRKKPRNRKEARISVSSAA